VRRAIVNLSGRVTITDDRGRFAFTDVAPGRVSLSASKPAYLSAAFGATRPGGAGTPIVLAPGQQMTDVTLRLTRGAVITGTIRNEQGQPAPQVSLRLYQFRFVNGQRRLNPTSPGMTPATSTDDRGMYRFFGIAPGEYYVGAELLSGSAARVTTAVDLQDAARLLQAAGRARPSTAPAAASPSRTVTYAGVFYPGVADISDARTLIVVAGEERSGIDFSLQLVPTATVSGSISGAGDLRASAAQVSLVRLSESPLDGPDPAWGCL
jgi:hypothetical protein